MIVYPKVRLQAAADRKRLIALEERRRRTLYREPAPERVAPPVSLPAVRMGSVTDEDIGLTPDPVAQVRAETYLSAVIAHRLREEDIARRRAEAAARTVHVEVDDASLHLAHVIDHGIHREMRRLEAMPLPKWMVTDRDRLAS